MYRFLPSPVAETCVVNMFLPEQQVHVRGSLSEPVMECLLLFVPHSQGSPALVQVAADDLWNHLWVGKSKRHDMQVNRRVFWVLHEWVRSKIKEDTRQTSHADRSVKALQWIKIFRSCPPQTDSPPYSGTRPSLWVTAEWTWQIVRIKNMQSTPPPNVCTKGSMIGLKEFDTRLVTLNTGLNWNHS